MKPTTRPKFTVQFEHGDPMPIKDFTDDEIERARKRCERKLGRPLRLGWRTDFPPFTVCLDGEEIAGG